MTRFVSTRPRRSRTVDGPPVADDAPDRPHRRRSRSRTRRTGSWRAASSRWSRHSCCNRSTCTYSRGYQGSVPELRDDVAPDEVQGVEVGELAHAHDDVLGARIGVVAEAVDDLCRRPVSPRAVFGRRGCSGASSARSRRGRGRSRRNARRGSRTCGRHPRASRRRWWRRRIAPRCAGSSSHRRPRS